MRAWKPANKPDGDGLSQFAGRGGPHGNLGHIARDNPPAADRALDAIDDACAMLAANPHAGPRREDLATGLRFYPVGNHLVFFTIHDDGITVARVIHGARDYRLEFD